MSKSRKLMVLALAVSAVCALVVAQALAATTTWTGAGTNDPVFKVAFTKVKPSGQPAKVKDFASKQLHFTCTGTSQPPFRANTTIHTPITVHSGAFSRTASFFSGNLKVTYTITGKFLSVRTATGTYKERRALASNPSVHCDSVQEPWKAHKQ